MLNREKYKQKNPKEILCFVGFQYEFTTQIEHACICANACRTCQQTFVQLQPPLCWYIVINEKKNVLQYSFDHHSYFAMKYCTWQCLAIHFYGGSIKLPLIFFLGVKYNWNFSLRLQSSVSISCIWSASFRLTPSFWNGNLRSNFRMKWLWKLCGWVLNWAHNVRNYSMHNGVLNGVLPSCKRMKYQSICSLFLNKHCALGI